MTSIDPVCGNGAMLQTHCVLFGGFRTVLVQLIELEHFVGISPFCGIGPICKCLTTLIKTTKLLVGKRYSDR